MPKKVSILLLVLLLLFVPIASIYVGYVDASLTSCGATVSSSTVTAGSSSELIFSISNTGGADMLWIRITSPSSNFTLTSIDGPSNIGETSISDDGMSVTMILSGISDGETADYTVGIDIGSEAVSSASFVVETSDSTNGDNSITCTGSLAVSSILNSQLGVMISNLVSSISDSSVLLTWSTGSNSTGTVYYGTSASYGNSVADSTSSTSHSVRINGLSSSTTYHYKIISSDGTNNDELSDKTFTTSASGETKIVTSTVTSTVTNTVRELYKDVILPSIKVKTELKKIYEAFPSIDFVASDESGISRIRYSIDNALNWYPINIDDKIGKNQIASSFTPSITDDGEYILIIEVTDAAGNKSYSKELKTTIDRLPPIVGPLIVMSGPQIVNVGSSNNLDLIVDVEYKFILSAAGGPSSMEMACGDQKYDFVKNIDTGVWVAKIEFDDANKSCTPVITAVDGAGNIQEKNSNTIVINKRGVLKNGTVTVYWYDSFENKFVLWDASPYGQNNPISTGATGGYAYLLPQGKYYIEAKAAGKRTTVSNIIDIKGAAIVNDDWQLKPVWKFWQVSEEMKVNPKILGSPNWSKSSVSLPKINLSGVGGVGFSTLDARGGISVIGLFASWHPQANEYLKTLDQLNLNGVKSYPVLLQEKTASANFLKLRGGYKLNIFADSDGEFLNGLNINGLPATLIVNKFGQIVYEKFGNISYKEVLDVISKID